MPTDTILFAAGASVLFTAFVTWPQIVNLGTAIAAHDDPNFSMWRLSWIAHALVNAPSHILDGNIFHPAVRTLTFSDATLLEGAIAAPLLWARVPPAVTYNIMLLGGIASCGVAMFVLARELVGCTGPALVSAAIFTMAPYRIEHFMHLELQWAMWIPLTFWALHRAIEGPSIRSGAWAGAFLFLQTISCVYYGAFLAVASASLALLLGLNNPRQLRGAVPALLAAALVAAVLIAPYAWPYAATARLLGPRNLSEIATYSATPTSYFTAPPQNWLWGWTAFRWGRPELNLYPGFVAVALAVAAIAYRPRRLVFVYAALAAIAIELSFGINGWLYTSLAGLGLQGLRSPSRAAIVVCCALAMLAGFGVRALQARITGRRGMRLAVLVSLLLLALDYRNTGMILGPVDKPADGTVYRVMRAVGPGVVVELPLPVPEGLPGREAQFEFWSITHWFPLVNGYSGHYTAEYIRTIDTMRTFPDDESIARLKRLGVRYVVVHRAFYKPEQHQSLMLAMGNRPELHSYGTYKDPIGARISSCWTRTHAEVA